MPMQKSIVTAADSYKYSQVPDVYPKDTSAMSSYIQARVKGQKAVSLGISMFIDEYLTTPVTKEIVDEAEYVITSHGEPFDRGMWDRVINEYGGYLPIEIYAVPEGTVVDSDVPLVTVECDIPGMFTLASFIETPMQRSVWYPTTIASQGLELYKNLKWMYEKYSDNIGNLGFALNDFGQRGATSHESAVAGGLGHLIYFNGTDNVSALMGARHYYGADIAGYSVPASEHSVQCSYGEANQRTYLKTMLDTYAKPGGIVSIVLDGYDVYRESNLLCTEFKEQIIASGAKVVFRPDSGDMFVVVPRLLAMQEAAFGFTLNSKGKKVINNVGIIQGDGINPTSAMMLMQKVIDLGYAPECVVLGSGGGLLQSVTRDTMKFAQKTSAMKIGGLWVDTVKNPITDQGKKSRGGRQFSDLYVPHYRYGEVLCKPTWDEMKARALNF